MAQFCQLSSSLPLFFRRPQIAAICAKIARAFIADAADHAGGRTGGLGTSVQDRHMYATRESGAIQA